MKKVLLITALLLILGGLTYFIYFRIKLHEITGDYKLGDLKTATVLVQDGSYYGPPYDKSLYQFQLDPFQPNPSFHLFGKSINVDLKKYLSKIVVITYRKVEGVVMGEQQLVYIEAIKEISSK